MNIKIGIVRFPGSNCDYDIYRAFKILNCNVSFLWCEETNLCNYDLIVLPGGFSYGDYEGVGITASRTPVVKKLKDFTEDGGKVIGICNGFQILVAAKLLPGRFEKNKCETYFCGEVPIKLTSREFGEGIVSLPIANGYGNFQISDEEYENLLCNEQILMRYVNEEPTGSYKNIAGICDTKHNIFGIMPHPERAISLFFENNNGLIILQNFLKNAFYEN